MLPVAKTRALTAVVGAIVLAIGILRRKLPVLISPQLRPRQLPNALPG